MNKMSLFPISKEVMPLIRYSSLLSVNVVEAVAPLSSGLVGKDCGFIDKGPNTGVIIRDTFDWNQDMDVVLLTLSDLNIPKCIYLDYIYKSVELKRKVLITKRLQDLFNFPDISPLVSVLPGALPTSYSKLNTLKKINTPVILSCELGLSHDSISVGLALKEFFASKGYAISNFANSDYSEIYGFKQYPLKITNELSLSSKIILLNDFFYESLNNNDYDLAIIASPFPLSLHRSYRVYDSIDFFHAITEAIDIDVCIISVCMSTSEKIIDISKQIKDKYEIPEVYINITNQLSLEDESTNKFDKNDTVTVALPGEYISDNEKVFYYEDKKSRLKSFNSIYDFLTEEVSII